MALVSEYLKRCGVKISTYVCGAPSVGSGVVYETPNYCDYNYVLTAKHIFQEDSQTEYKKSKIGITNISYLVNNEFQKLQHIKEHEIEDRFISFEEDFLIIIIKKDNRVNFSPILVTDKLENNDVDFFSWSIFSANENQLHLFDYKRNDHEVKRLKLLTPPSHGSLPGMSGSGVFIKDKHILYGVVHNYPNENFENDTIDCTNISFEKINNRLKLLGKIQLDTESSRHKREINNTVVDLHQAMLNDTCLDLELARKRLKTDIIDDWFHDPLKYIDLLNQEYLFKQFQQYYDNNTYVARKTEQFYVPKKKFTLRKALISPFIDRIMYMAVVGVLAEKLDNALISNVYSARYSKFNKNQMIINGVEQWKKMQYILAEKAYSQNAAGDFLFNCIIEIDLLNFYDNINIALLIKKIERVCETPNEKKACKLLKEILLKFNLKQQGLPQNSDASSLLATFYLNQVDVLMQYKAGEYYRFMDDIRIFCKDKYEARQILQAFEFEISRCYLSVNSQKTEIISIKDTELNLRDGERFRGKFNLPFDLELNQIARYRKSENYVYLNQAFHLSIKLLGECVNEDLNASEDLSRKLNFALNTIEILCKKKITLYSSNPDLKEFLLAATIRLKDRPWMTTQVCKVLNLLSPEIIKDEFLIHLSEILINQNYNTYTFQTFQIWLLLAKHKCKSEQLMHFAVNSIERNDDNNKAAIASMIIYACSVDKDFNRVILRKYNEGFAREYFQNRIALISLRAFDTEILTPATVDESLIHAHQFIHKYKDKDLVYINGFDEGNEDSNYLEQLYSI